MRLSRNDYVYDPQTKRKFRVKCNCPSTINRDETERFVNRDPARYIKITQEQYNDQTQVSF